MTIERVEKLSHCPEAVRLGLEGLTWLHARGWTEDAVSGLGWDNKALVAWDGVVAVGLLIYQEVDWKRSISIEMGYVREGDRKSGVYRALWQELVMVAKEKGFAWISGTTHVGNLDMQRVAHKLGRQLRWLVYDYRVTKDEQDQADAP